MRFLALDGLSGLAQAAAISAGIAAVAALVVMYFLKLKRMRHEVSSTFLWKKSVEDMRANSPFQRLRRNLLLFLQLLILLAALFALLRPSLSPRAAAGTSYIVLLDNSASMSATDVSPSRFEEAIGRVDDVIDDMSPGDTMMLMTFAAHPHVAATFTDDKNALRIALGAVSVTHARTEIDEPLKLADALARTVPDPEIVLVSDGKFLRPPSLEAVAAPVRFVGVGRQARNLGITAINVRRGVDDPSAGQIFVGVKNFSDARFTTIVSLTIDGKLLDASTVSIDAGAQHSAVFKVRLDADRVAEVSIDADDDLAADNRAWALLEPPQEVDVTVVGPASPFLKRALTAGGRFTVGEAAVEPPIVAEGSNLPVFVYEGAAPRILSRAGYLVFNASSPAEGFQDLGAVENPVVIDVDTSHPVTSFLDLGDLFILKSKKMSFPAETKVLVNGDEVPLVALSYSGGARVITVAFDPMDSRWPLRISYPMFITNAVNFLAGGADALSSRQSSVGDVLVLPGKAGSTVLGVTDPAGKTWTLSCTEDGTATFGDAHLAGIYKVEAGGDVSYYAANLANAVESEILPAREFAVGAEKVAAAAAPLKNREMWRELLVFAFVVLLVEWYIYNRRVYI